MLIVVCQAGKRQPLLARAEDSSADPSPKKHKTGSSCSTNRSKRSRLEERLSNAELRYIDSGSPDQVSVQLLREPTLSADLLTSLARYFFKP